MGSGLSIVNDTPYTHFCEVGEDEAALAIGMFIVKIFASLVAFIPGVAFLETGFGAAVDITEAAITAAQGAEETRLRWASDYEDKGYVRIPPGGKHRWERSLSLWQQGHCIKQTEVNDGFIVEGLYMRPIFSGSTDGSNRDHHIQHWDKKWGYEEKKLIMFEKNMNPAKIAKFEELAKNVELEELAELWFNGNDGHSSEIPALRGNLF